jgi:prolipoprotein diacylglyceryl transferase
MTRPVLALGQYIPSPPVSGFHVGPAFIHFYGLMYVVGIALAIYITRRRLAAAGGDPALVYDVATWVVPAGIIGARIYFDITTPFDITPHTWWGPFAIWNGGLGVWGGIAVGALVGAWRVRRSGASVGVFMDAVAPALLVAQAIGRLGNYFDQQLFGKPSTLPWALEISRAARLSAGMPAQYLKYSTFQPSFLYELIFDLAWAALLVWLGHHRKIRPPGLFALYVAGYSGYRIFEETIRIDSSAYFLGLRLNFFVAIVMTLVGLIWFAISQRKPAVLKGTAALIICGAVAAAAAGCSQQGRPTAAAAHPARIAPAQAAPARVASVRGRHGSPPGQGAR